MLVVFHHCRPRLFAVPEPQFLDDTPVVVIGLRIHVPAASAKIKQLGTFVEIFETIAANRGLPDPCAIAV
ncbi:hypothetical protein ASD31_14755 [Rhizobium sp. Root482]|nr:hypothetical protein ASD31_14755 [Rhizobium sp. Root482]